VSKAELGTKRICGNCSAKFYDLLKNPIVCPKCSTVFVPPAATQAKPRRVVDYPRPAAAVVHEEVAEIKDSDETVPDDGKEDKELEEKIDDAGLIVLDEQDDGDDVGGILGGDVKKDEGS
jgi:uncharacterized protein (TIGR02300 family)